MSNNSSIKPNPVFRAVPKLHLGILISILILFALTNAALPNNQPISSRDFLLPDQVLGKTRVLAVKNGDNLSLMAQRLDISGNEIFQVLDSGEDAKRLLELYPGQQIEFSFDKYQRFTGLKYQPSLTETLYVSKTLDGFAPLLDVKEFNTNLKFSSGVIEDSLFMAGYKANLNDNIIMELANIFGWDVDFVLDIRKGDSFNVLYEEKFLDNRKVKNGNILIAQFTNQGKTHTAVRYEDDKGNSDYFTPEGYSMRKTFRRNPLDIVRITSRFNLKRKHPILHKIRAHKGVDYAAGRGTPIRATGDGKIINARKKGGYGNTIVIKHGQKYSTLYAHLSKYGRRIREGRNVKQGQIIGYVGSSGLATGPHLHYEFRVNGVHRNPLTVKFPHAKPINKHEKERFLEYAGYIEEKRGQYEAKTLYANTDADHATN